MERVAFITGAGGYLGCETARAFAQNGVKVAICDINAQTLKNTEDKIIADGGTVKAYVADVTKSKSIDEAVQAAFEHFGRLDILVHVAGGAARIAGKNAKFVPLVEQEDYVIETVLNVNLLGALYSNRAAAKIMIEQGQGGKIINFSSTVGLNGLVHCCDYSAAKAGVMAMTKSLAKELGAYKINVNSVAPGIVMRPDEAGGDERALKTNVFGEKCLAEDITGIVLFLASEKARFITGQTYVVDGGRSLSMKGSD